MPSSLSVAFSSAAAWARMRSPESCSKADTGLSSSSEGEGDGTVVGAPADGAEGVGGGKVVGVAGEGGGGVGSGKGGVVRLGEFQELPREDTPLDTGDI